jgi:hypothetical protein
MPSHLITIMRRPNPTNLPDDVYNDSKQKIGSVFTATGDIIRGLTFSEQKQYLPEIIGISATDNQFTPAVRDYYLNLTITVPAGGLDLEVGLDKEDHPINLLDYIRYKFACAHPAVVEDEDAITSSKRIRYFFKDSKKDLIDAKVGLEKRKKSYKEFIKLTDKEERMDMVLRVYGYSPESLTLAEKELNLEELQEDNPEYFISVATDKDLEKIALIEQLLTAEALRKVGNSILDGDIVLGDSMEEAVLYLKDKKNSNILTALKAKLRAFA